MTSWLLKLSLQNMSNTNLLSSMLEFLSVFYFFSAGLQKEKLFTKNISGFNLMWNSLWFNHVCSIINISKSIWILIPSVWEVFLKNNTPFKTPVRGFSIWLQLKNYSITFQIHGILNQNHIFNKKARGRDTVQCQYARDRSIPRITSHFISSTPHMFQHVLRAGL